MNRHITGMCIAYQELINKEAEKACSSVFPFFVKIHATLLIHRPTTKSKWTILEHITTFLTTNCSSYSALRFCKYWHCIVCWNGAV